MCPANGERFLERKIFDEDQKISAVVCVPLNSPASNYAIPMHENQYEPGVKSQEKAAKLGVEVGRRYITRGVEVGKGDYEIILKAHLEAK